MLVLESEQGTDKSTAFRTLTGEDWFSDDLPLNSDSKQVIERTAGKWIVEAAELKGMRRGETEGLKAFLSRSHDRARLAYDRLTQRFRANLSSSGRPIARLTLRTAPATAASGPSG